MRERIRERIQARMASQQQDNTSPNLHFLTYDGLERSYLLFSPTHAKTEHPLPLLIVLHGGGGNAEGQVQIAGNLNTYASQKGVMVVYANGTGPFQNRFLTWNAGICCGSALDNQVDDVGFIRTLIQTLESQYHIDQQRIFAAGFSNGAMLTYRLGCELSGILSGIMPVSGALDIPCAPKQPISVMAFNGTADQHVLYKGGQGPEQMDRKHPPRTDTPVSQTIHFWTTHNHCTSKPQQTQHGHIIRDVYPGCQTGTSVILYTIVGGGHAWPGGQAYRGGAQPTSELSASQQMIDFMLAHPKSKPQG